MGKFVDSPFRRTVTMGVLAIGLLAGPNLAAPSGASPRQASSTLQAKATRVAAAAPTPSPARPGKPTSIVAVGDSITQATGTGPLSQENPKNSWATGTNVNSVAARLGIPTNKRYNVSANGDKMVDFAPQIQNGKSGGSGSVIPAPADTGLVLVEFGGNDLCKDSVASMTSVETYRSQFKAGLNQVVAQAPTALLQVLSVPDIYNLWYIRGAPQNSTYHPEPESGQASGINGARFYWDGLTSIGVKFPCQSLLTNPDSYSDGDRQRRQDVRTRNQEYNQVLADECAKVMRCRFDDKQLFNLTSNRVSPPNGPLLPQASWNFTDMDISRNVVALCPIPGITGNGCGDHFHPSEQGQGKIALLATIAGRNWEDTSFPTAGGSVIPSTRPDGVHRVNASVTFTGADAEGLRGQETRVHNPDGSISPWTQAVGIAPNRVVTGIGRSYVEVRSLDINGNLSAGSLIPVDVLAAGVPAAPEPPTVVSSAAGYTVKWVAPDDGGSTLTQYELVPVLGAPASDPQAPIATASTSAPVPTPPPGVLVRYKVTAKNGIGDSPQSVSSVPTLAPFSSLEGFVRRQHGDFTKYTPQGPEVLANMTSIDSGATYPSDLINSLRASEWFGGAYGPAIRLYRAYFLRLPDPSGLDFWANRRRNGYTLSSISQQFSTSSEFKRRYGSLSNTAFIDQIYNNVFGRDPDPSGRDFYLRKLTTGGWNRGQVVLQFSESSEYQRLTDGIVAVIEFARGMNGKAPSTALFDQLLAAWGSGGSAGAKAVFEILVAAPAYKARILSLS